MVTVFKQSDPKSDYQLDCMYVCINVFGDVNQKNIYYVSDVSTTWAHYIIICENYNNSKSYTDLVSSMAF